MKHTYKQKILVVTMLALTSGVARAQADFRPGYIVRPAGDTVRGLVDYRGARQGGQQCVFRVETAKTSTAFAPAQLRGYGLASGERFLSQLTPGRAQLPALARPDAAADTAGQGPRSWFLEVLAQGPATLFGRRDEQGLDHYYVYKAGAPLPAELVAVRRLVPDGNGTRELVLPVYRGTLTEQFADCPAVLLSISRTAFTSSGLVAAVTSYNACRQPGQAAAASPARFDVGLEVLVGGQASRTTYTSLGSSAEVPAGLAPEVGVALRVGRRVLRQKLTFRPELHYVRQVAEASASSQVYQPGPNQTINQRYDLRFTTAYLRLPVLLRYTVPGTKVRPFVEAGGSFSYAITLEPQLRQTGGISSDWQPLFANRPGASDALRHYEFGLVAGLGVQFPGLLGGHALAALGRVERTDGFLRTTEYSTAVLRGSFLVSFDLAKSK